MEKTEIELNEEYKFIIIEMRLLNAKRFEVYKNFKKLKSDAVTPRSMVTPSMYHDLYGNDLDEEK